MLFSSEKVMDIVRARLADRELVSDFGYVSVAVADRGPIVAVKVCVTSPVPVSDLLFDQSSVSVKLSDGVGGGVRVSVGDKDSDADRVRSLDDVCVDDMDSSRDAVTVAEIKNDGLIEPDFCVVNELVADKSTVKDLDCDFSSDGDAVLDSSLDAVNVEVRDWDCDDDSDNSEVKLADREGLELSEFDKESSDEGLDVKEDVGVGELVSDSSFVLLADRVKLGEKLKEFECDAVDVGSLDGEDDADSDAVSEVDADISRVAELDMDIVGVVLADGESEAL